MNKEDILGIIPARYASTRFPGKPLADIGGKPMIQRVYEQASKALTHVVVATDDERIMQAVQHFGGKVVMTASTHQSGTDRCAEALNRYGKSTGKKFNIVVNIQGDEPFIDPEQIETLLSCFDQPETQIATLVKPAGDAAALFDPNKPKVVTGAKAQALYFSRSPIPHLRGLDESQWHRNHRYLIHLGLYAYRAEVLRAITLLTPTPLEIAESLEQLRWLEHGYHITTKITHHESYSIDSPDDLTALNLIKEKNVF